MTTNAEKHMTKSPISDCLTFTMIKTRRNTQQTCLLPYTQPFLSVLDLPWELRKKRRDAKATKLVE